MLGHDTTLRDSQDAISPVGTWIGRGAVDLEFIFDDFRDPVNST